jgi:hypothetical protein
MIFLSWFILLIAAILESGGDTLIRQGLRGSSLLLMAAGSVVPSSTWLGLSFIIAGGLIIQFGPY